MISIEAEFEFHSRLFFITIFAPMLKVSIILPIKNTANYLVECLDSICNQTYQNWELLAVNDASIDDSLSIIQAFAKKDRRIKALDNPKPGLLQALRFGYKHATGDLIHRMDSDDIMPLDKLLKMTNAYKKGSVVTGATKYFSDEGPVGDGFLRYDKWLMEVAKQNTYRQDMYKECVIPSNCWLIHRDDFEAVGGFEHDTFPEDYDLCLRFITAGYEIIGLPLILHHWRDRKDRISRNWDEYKDNRFFKLKVDYFYKVDRDSSRPLVLWGAGKNGKDVAKLLLQKESNFYWVCDNDKKIGKDIYGLKMQHFNHITTLNFPQIIIAVASPDGQKEIKSNLNDLGFINGVDYWLFG